jgi:hypothetical protein
VCGAERSWVGQHGRNPVCVGPAEWGLHVQHPGSPSPHAPTVPGSLSRSLPVIFSIISLFCFYVIHTKLSTTFIHNHFFSFSGLTAITSGNSWCRHSSLGIACSICCGCFKTMTTYHFERDCWKVNGYHWWSEPVMSCMAEEVLVIVGLVGIVIEINSSGAGGAGVQGEVGEGEVRERSC